jgi:hypothetical protein
VSRVPEIQPFGAGERVRLWCSYQRYALLLVASAAAIVAGIALAAPDVWYAWALAALPVLKILAFAAEVYQRFGRKMRATALAARRIAEGRFHARSVRGYCGDPCFRVVAHEILRRAGKGRRERRRLIRGFTAEARGPALVVSFNPDNPDPIQVRGSLVADRRSARSLDTTPLDAT